jgi:hypothetical protein
MPEGFELTNEFARVRVELDETALGDRLRVIDLRRGVEAHLDPLEVEALTRATHEQLRALVDPAAVGEDQGRAGTT